MELDPAVLASLHLSADQTWATTSSGRGSSSASTVKISSIASNGSLLAQGEFESLQAISAAVPNLCPRSLGIGTYTSSPSTHFIVTQFLRLYEPRFPFLAGVYDSIVSRRPDLAAKLARLHTTPAPVPEGFKTAQFGFPVTTCCGDTPQDNSFKSSWATFFAENRLKHILQQCKTNQGVDLVIRQMIEDVVATVVPRLLGDDHLGNGKGVTPVVVHGELWYGNVGRSNVPNEPPHDVIFDPSACYAHNEYELGIMRMFGGFSQSFFSEYHALCPKTEPVRDYEDRLKLYELYHHLNHYAIFGPMKKYTFLSYTYRDGSIVIMRDLLRKYGQGR